MEPEQPAQRFGAHPAALTASAPGRVNLIGEHTDYTGGLVLPMAIPFQTNVEIAHAADGMYTFHSAQFQESRVMPPSDQSPAAGNWSDYSVGVLRELQALGVRPEPFYLTVDGNVPLGSGLSSSASIEVATAMALLQHTGKHLPIPEIALLCQRAENVYVHSPCGIMDQFAITAATAGHALLLNTRDLTYQLLPMNTGELAGCVVVVVNSMVRHTVTAGSEYAQRRRELEAGQQVLRERFGVRDLGEATVEQLLACAGAMSAESLKRCRHVITENGRVREAAEAMTAGDAKRLGELMTAAHASERDDFECSVEEVDFLVDTAVQQAGCFGARLTGGGFGGCTVNLLLAGEADRFTAAIRQAYQERYGITAQTFVCEAAAGAVERAATAGSDVTAGTDVAAGRADQL
ncbi:galactokinase [Terriglobus sp.]|uniref:galactokinase n=1 Tax=Terriglobus sp. TaxID=1889013 RepID=UPI003B00EC62